MARQRGVQQQYYLKEKRLRKKRAVDELQYGEKYCPRCNHHSVNVFWIKHRSGQRVWRYALVDGTVTKVKASTVGCWRCSHKEQVWVLPGEDLIDVYNYWFDKADWETKFSWFARTTFNGR